MKSICPVCKSHQQRGLDLHVEGFYENISECRICGTTWAVHHGRVEVVRDAQKNSFMEAVSECVEADDYAWAVYAREA